MPPGRTAGDLDVPSVCIHVTPKPAVPDEHVTDAIKIAPRVAQRNAPHARQREGDGRQSLVAVNSSAEIRGQAVRAMPCTLPAERMEATVPRSLSGKVDRAAVAKTLQR